MKKGAIVVLGTLVFLVVLAAAMIMVLLLLRYGLRPETAAVGIASATIIGALITQVVNAYIARSNQKHTQELADQRAQAEALQTYLERMSELVTKGGLRAQQDAYNEQRILARVQTKTVLLGLDPVRKRHLLLFLREMRLINRYKYEVGDVEIFPQIVGLTGADLENAYLREARLISTSREEPVSLEGVILKNADLVGADLERANLKDADLEGADMEGASLGKADLRGANLQETNLTKRQIEQAIGDETTLLPDNLPPPESWSVRIEEPG